MELKSIPVDQIYAPNMDSAGGPSLEDGDEDPIIVSWEDALQAYDLIDGYHRLSGMLGFGEETVTAIVVNKIEASFWDDQTAMREAEWIEWIQLLAHRRWRYIGGDARQ